MYTVYTHPEICDLSICDLSIRGKIGTNLVSLSLYRSTRTILWKTNNILFSPFIIVAYVRRYAEVLTTSKSSKTQ